MGPQKGRAKTSPVSIAELVPPKARKQPPAGDRCPGHDGAVVERWAGGRAAVAGHGSQQEALSCGVHHKEGHLDHTALEGDGPVRGQKVDQQPGCDHRGVADIKERGR